MSYSDLSEPIFEVDGYEEMTENFDATQEFPNEAIDELEVAQYEQKINILTQGLKMPSDNEDHTLYSFVTTKEEKTDFTEIFCKNAIECRDKKQISSETRNKMRTTLDKHESMGTKHLKSANFIDSQRLPELNFRIKFLEQMKCGTEVDMVHHWNEAEKSDVHFKGFTLIQGLYEAINSSLECFKKTKKALEQSSWEHKSLAQLHQKVFHFRKLNKKKAVLIRDTMNRLINYQSIATLSLFDAENTFEIVNQELTKTNEVIEELKGISHEIENRTEIDGTSGTVWNETAKKDNFDTARGTCENNRTHKTIWDKKMSQISAIDNGTICTQNQSQTETKVSFDKMSGTYLDNGACSTIWDRKTSQNAMEDKFDRVNGTYEFNGTNGTTWTENKSQTSKKDDFDTASSTYGNNGTYSTVWEKKNSQIINVMDKFGTYNSDGRNSTIWTETNGSESTKTDNFDIDTFFSTYGDIGTFSTVWDMNYSQVPNVNKFDWPTGTDKFDERNGTIWTENKSHTETEVKFDKSNGTYEPMEKAICDPLDNFHGTSGTLHTDQRKSLTIPKIDKLHETNCTIEHNFKTNSWGIQNRNKISEKNKIDWTNGAKSTMNKSESEEMDSFVGDWGVCHCGTICKIDKWIIEVLTPNRLVRSSSTNKPNGTDGIKLANKSETFTKMNTLDESSHHKTNPKAMDKSDGKNSNLKNRNGSNRAKIPTNDKLVQSSGTKKMMTTMGMVIMLKTQDTGDFFQEVDEFNRMNGNIKNVSSKPKNPSKDKFDKPSGTKWTILTRSKTKDIEKSHHDKLNRTSCTYEKDCTSGTKWEKKKSQNEFLDKFDKSNGTKLVENDHLKFKDMPTPEKDWTSGTKWDKSKSQNELLDKFDRTNGTKLVENDHLKFKDMPTSAFESFDRTYKYSKI